MNIDITPIDGRNVDIPVYIDFVINELKKHISLVKDSEYKKIAFTPSNQNSFKSFFEEVVPLMFFLQMEGHRYQKIKYMAGSQKGDAILDNKTTVEITKAQNKHEYLATQDILNHGYAFSSKNIQKVATANSPTKTQPYAYTNNEHVIDIAQNIQKAIEKKQKKNYPELSILLILFDSDSPLLDCDGDYTYLNQEIVKYDKDIFSNIYIVENIILENLKPKWQCLL